MSGGWGKLYGPGHCNFLKNHIYCGKKRKACCFPFSGTNLSTGGNDCESCADTDGCNR